MSSDRSQNSKSSLYKKLQKLEQKTEEIRRIQLMVGKKSKVEDFHFTAPTHLDKQTSKLPDKLSSRINSLGFNINTVKNEDPNAFLMLNQKEFVQKSALSQAIKDGDGVKSNKRFTMLKSNN